MSSEISEVQSVGRYNVLRKIGSGGMAEVFLARSKGALGTEKLLVTKKIHPALASNSKFIEMFVDEARVAMRLNHSNIVQVYAFEHIDGDHILAMEHVDGADLHGVLAALRSQGIRLPFGLAAFITAEVAKGLDYAHSRRDDHGEPLDIVHRDVSPQNTLISRDGAVKVTDFGIAKARSLHEEDFGSVKGKLGYMAPEQARGQEVDHRADVFSLGVVLHEMLVGEPLVKQSEDGVQALVKKGDHKEPWELDQSIPKELSRVVARAMAPTANDRYGSAREMAQDLGIYLHSEENIFDSHTLQNWMEENLTSEVLGDPRPEILVEPLVRSDGTESDDDVTIPMGSLGEVEKRLVVMVTARVKVEGQSDSGTPLHNEIARLADEIAYKAHGVFQESNEGIRIFLGLPNSAMEDAIRALRLAHDVMDVIGALSRDNPIGIDGFVAVNRGFVSSTRVEDGNEPTFQPDKDLTESARDLLREAKGGEILAGGGVFRLARREYNFQEFTGGVEGKSSAHGVPETKAYIVGGARSRGERSVMGVEAGSFLGRGVELSRLEEVCRRAMKERTGVIKVVGELGIGKSRLVRRFLEKHVSDDLVQIKVECLFAERDSPLATVAATYRSVLGMREDDPSKKLRERMAPLLKQAPKYLGRQTVFLGPLLDSADLLWASAGNDRRDLVRRAAFGLGVVLGKSVGEKGGILVVENAHWMDGPSVDVLSELASQGGGLPILVILVGYPDTLTERRIEGMETLQIPELPDSCVKNFVMEKLGSGIDMVPIAEQVTARAQGNPFFASEIIDSLVERGLLAPTGDRLDNTAGYKQARPGAIRLPTTMEGLAASQIDAVEPGLRTVLRVASAVGAVFTAETLSGLSGRNVSKDLDSLMEQDLLVLMRGAEEEPDTYRFKKAMVREAAYSGLSTQDRHRIHRALAEDLVGKKEAGEPIPSGRIAWHLEHGAEPREAGRYYFQGGVAAMNVYSNRRALRLFDRALDVIPTGDEDRFQVLERRERALRDLGLHEDRVRNVEEMDAMASSCGDKSKMTRAANMRAQMEHDRARFEQAATSVSTALRLSEQTKDLFHRVESLRLLAYIAMEAGHMVRALRCCDKALDILAEGSEGIYSRGRVLGIKGLVLMTSGELELAPGCLAEALSIFRQLGKRRNESTAMSNIALLAQARGDMIEAVDFLERAVLIDLRNKDVSARGRKLVAGGWIRVELGDLDEASKFLEEGRQICLENREPLGEAEADLGMADLWLARQDPEGARELLQEAERRGFIGGSRILMVRHRQLTSKAAFVLGDFKSAFESAKEATIIARDAGMIGEVVHGASLGGMALAELGHTKEAIELTDQVETLIQSTGGVRRAEEIWWSRGWTLHRGGQKESAGSALAKARMEMERKSALIGRTWLRMAYNNHPLIKQIISGFDG